MTFLARQSTPLYINPPILHGSLSSPSCVFQFFSPRIITNCSRHHFKSAFFTLNPLSPQQHPPFVFITSKAPQRRPLILRPVLATNMFSRELPYLFFFNCFSPMDELLLRKEQVARPSKRSVEI